jgi:uncharacterized coiled-coil protein SlyX
MNEIASLQEKIMYLEKHVEEQDGEIYRQARLLENCLKKIEKLESRFDAVEASNSSGSEMPADEKPPHY